MRTVPPTEKGKYRAITTGAIANGKPVLVNSDGTVSLVDGDALGSETVFETGNATTTEVMGATFDSNSNRVVFVYKDQGNSHYGTAVVGSVSGTTISFGTPVVFSSSDTDYPQCIFDSTNNKIIVVYQDDGDGNKGKGIVGTVDSSDNSISFGSAVTFNTPSSDSVLSFHLAFDSNAGKAVVFYVDFPDSQQGACHVISVSGTTPSFGSKTDYSSGAVSGYGGGMGFCTFDSSNNKVVVFYQDGANSNYGTARVGTISGTSISFGTAVVFDSTSSTYIGATFDTSSNKTVHSWTRGTASGQAAVGTVSGTDISFGTTTQFKGSAITHTSASYNSAANKVVFAYRAAAGGESDAGNYIIGTVSGTDISFGTAVAFNPSQSTGSPVVTYDSNAERNVFGYADGGNSNAGTARVFKVGTSELTTENYIGIANSCSFHGATETFTVTVASGALYGGGGTGNVFYLNGLSNPPIQLLKGHTYIFDQSDSSNSGHPLHFKDTGGSQYTSGVTVTGSAGSAGAKVTIVIPSDATEPSQYYCTAHGNGMGNLITIGNSFVNVDVIGTVNDQQSSLTAGQQYFVQENGTLGLTADSTSVFAGTAISATELVVKE